MQERLFEEPTFTVSELSAGIARAIARGFPDEVWVRGEVANLSRTTWGHVYFNLVDGEACLNVALFNSHRVAVNRVLQRHGGAVRITDGTEVRIRAEVTWVAKRGAVSLRMLSIDPAYTLGQLAAARDRLLKLLEAEGLLVKNAALRLPLVPLRVGLITSKASAAAADFLHTLESSRLGWQVQLADARVQGVDAVPSMVAALRTLATSRPPVDVICIVRGGGARTDLAAFDHETLARAIATSPVPVLTGIGHEIDSSVADLVAHASHKTPTACAAALVERVQAYVNACTDRASRIQRAAVRALDRSAARLDRANGRIVGASGHHLRAADLSATNACARLRAVAPRQLASAGRDLDGLGLRLAALDPERLLARGWSITHDRAGRLVRDANDLSPGDELVTTLARGIVRSQVVESDG